jgi:2-keto-myo-inositol isomerase
MKTCFNTITAGPEAPLEEIIAACGRNGFKGLEIEHNHLVGCLQRMPVAQVAHLLAEYRLAPASLMAFNLEVFGDPSGDLAQVREAAQNAQELGAPMLLIYCAAMVPSDMTHREAFLRAAKRVAVYADAAAPVTIALEPIGRTTVMGGPTEALEIARLSDRPNVGIVVDTFHNYLSQVPAAALRAVPREKLLIVHVNDAEERPISQLQDKHRLYPGRGILPLQEDLSLLREIGYDGFLSIEIFRPEYWARPLTQVVRESKEALDGVLERAGVSEAEENVCG